MHTQDRQDLIESELSGLAFDSNQQIFKTAHIDNMFSMKPPPPELNEAVYMFIDPAAGGPQSDYAVLSVTRHKGILTVIILELRKRLAAEVGLAQGLHKVGLCHVSALGPRRDVLLIQGVVESLGLVWTQGSHADGGPWSSELDVGEVFAHGLVLVEQHEKLYLELVQGITRGGPQELQSIDDPSVGILSRHINDRLLDEARDIV